MRWRSADFLEKSRNLFSPKKKKARALSHRNATQVSRNEPPETRWPPGCQGQAASKWASLAPRQWSGFWGLMGLLMTISDEKQPYSLPLKRWFWAPKRNVIRQFVFQSSFLGGYVDFRWRIVMVMMVNDGGDDGGDDGE